MATIEPFKGKFGTPRSMLARILEDADEMDSFFIMIRMKNGDAVPAHFKGTLEFFAFTGAYCLREAVAPLAETVTR